VAIAAPYKGYRAKCCTSGLNLGEIKKKTFLKTLYRKNESPERFYKINNFILDKCRKEEVKLFVSNMPPNDREGLFFIMDKNDLIIRRKTNNGLIVYAIRFSDFEEHFAIKISGKISVNDSEETFRIDETYPNSMRGSILNVFNIREIIALFNLLYTEFISKNSGAEKNNDIDNYLDGKIQND
jgi:hypothetical protein